MAFCASCADLCNNENAMCATVKAQTLFVKVRPNYRVIDYLAGTITFVIKFPEVLWLKYILSHCWVELIYVV